MVLLNTAARNRATIQAIQHGLGIKCLFLLRSFLVFWGIVVVGLFSFRGILYQFLHYRLRGYFTMSLTYCTVPALHILLHN